MFVSFIKRFYPYFILIFLEIALFATNYEPGTYLVGWDNLLPELNFQAAFTRNVFSVWQEYRGLGLLDGMSHAANLPHTIFLWLLHSILPTNLIRYFFIFLMHFLGGIGLFLLLEKKLLTNYPNKKIISLIGALFYLLNLATTQMFFAPFELFTVHFAFLPLLIWALLEYLDNPTKKSLIIFSSLSILSAPQAHVPTLFIVTLTPILFILLFRLLNKGKKFFRRAAVVLSLTFLLNAYWLLPFIYSASQNSQIIKSAKINQMSSENIYAKNKARGSLQDVLLLKGFMLDTTEYNLQGESVYIMTVWREHTKTPAFILPAIIFTLLTLLGVISSLVEKKKSLYPFAAAFFIALFFLGNNTAGLAYLNQVIRDISPTFAEVFRFSFTKFSILFVFCLSLFWAYGLLNLMRLTGKHLSSIFIFIILASIAIYAYPAFRGNFSFNEIKVYIPKEYFYVIDFFNSQDKNTRIAPLPQPSFWNWRYYNWGTRGSGFLWQGINQPMLVRAFDPWSNNNENYYWEMSYALYSQNLELFEKVLEKYQIDWLLLDENIINPSSPKALYTDELKNLVAQSKKIEQGRVFGKITIYKVNLETPVKDFVFLKNNLPTIAPAYSWNNYDPAFMGNSHYISLVNSEQLTVNSYYPYRSLFTGKNQADKEFQVKETDNSFEFVAEVPPAFKKASLIIPEAQEKLLFVDSNDLSKQEEKQAIIDFSQNRITVTVPKIRGYLSAQINSQQVLTLKSKDDNQAFWLPNLPHDRAYMITVQSRNITGQPSVFWLENLNSRRPDIETYLPQGHEWTTSYFIQPPMEEDGLGYTIHIDNIPVGSDKPVNELGKITVYQIPFKLLTHLSLQGGDSLYSETIPSFQEPVRVEHPNQSLYTIMLTDYRLPTTDKQTLILSQSFDKGWTAYKIPNHKLQIPKIFSPLLGQKIEDHVLVNNWANGWILTDEAQNSTIILVYLPQYLEHAGFILLFATLVFIIFPKSGKIQI